MGIGRPNERRQPIVETSLATVWNLGTVTGYGIRDTGYELEVVAHGDEESTVESALGELFKTDDIVRTAVDGLCRESR